MKGEKKKNNEETKGKINLSKVNPKVDSKTSEDVKSNITLSSLDVFEKCIKRAENLISLHTKTEEISEISEQHYCDCYRAAVVLTISALDAFVRTIVISEIRRNLMDTKKALPAKLSEYLKNLLTQDKLLEAARNYNLLEKVEEAVRNDFETKSFQGEWKISSFLEMVGYNDIFSEVATKADINEKNLRKKLNIFTSRRHVIAHSGDYNLNQNPPNEINIDKRYAAECIENVSLFAKTVNEIIEKK